MILSHIKQFLYQFWSALICSKGPSCFQPPICSALPVIIKKWPQNVLIHNIQEHPRCFTQRGSVLTKLLVWKSIYLSKPVKSSSVIGRRGRRIHDNHYAKKVICRASGWIRWGIWHHQKRIETTTGIGEYYYLRYKSCVFLVITFVITVLDCERQRK